MIVLSTAAEQTVAPNQQVTFDTRVSRTGNAECWRRGTGSVKMCQQGIYELHFSGNVASATADAPIQLQMQTSGVNLPETVMISTPSAANTSINNVSTETLYRNCCGDYDMLTIVNTGEEPVILSAGACLFVKRVA